MKTSVQDANRKLVFEITAQDVKEAKRHDKTHCVIACAVGSMPGVKGISVGASTVRVRTDAGIRRYATPKNLKEALTEFDATGFWALPAGVYTLNPPPPWLKQEALVRRLNAAGRPINPNTGKPYAKTGLKKTRVVNPRVLEFMKIKKAARVAA